MSCEALRIAAGLNLKRLLKKRGWGRRPFPAEAMYAFFLAAAWWLTRISLASVSGFLVMGADDRMGERVCISSC